ncbi:MAG: hypothetical protein GTN89_09780 [Acidobacteria bacterium]|nr:hypothetical protein [Acidobacteriota bacterium]NIQ30643.1 hypothetical protein [Acidobacteriota bacterium]NIQ85601.1 hypothetical protein [Acidobacteriota bacterium]
MKSALALVVAGGLALPAAAECPPPEQIHARLAGIDMTRAARTALFNQHVPSKLHEKAINKPGKPFAEREGQRVTGVILAPISAEEIWRAINDEEHHAEGYLPVNFSTVIEGRPRGADRVLFQFYKRAGLGRWWASRVFINKDIHEATEGKIWELYWRSWMDRVDRKKPPASEVKVRPIETSEGAWMLVPLTESCTLVEQYSLSDPGGALGIFQALVATGAIRDTMSGIVEMATEHRCDPAQAVSFIGPDGKPLDPEPAEERAVRVRPSNGKPR